MNAWRPEKMLGIGRYTMYFFKIRILMKFERIREYHPARISQEGYRLMGKEKRTVHGFSPVLVWDLPTRLFHWLLVALVAVSFASGKIGGNAMLYHERCGEVILALLMFRVVWGFIGSSPSRFRTFLAGPATVLRYALTVFRREPDHHMSHNPLGGWSVMAMLLAMFIQAGTGLFANDDIATTGPLYKWVSKAASDRLTSIHHLNHDVIIIIIAVHVAAVLFHLIYKKENLILPMITGIKQREGDFAEATAQRPLWLVGLVGAAAAGAVYFLVK
jgi:cytochrome b